MTEQQARAAQATLWAAGWDVVAELSSVGDWWLKACAADGDGYVWGHSHNDMKVLILGGQVKKRQGA